MGKLSEFDRELISAYLDDALEGSELQQAKQLLVQNAEAALWLDQLTKMRASLKDLPVASSSSGPHLSGLAERVIAQARQVAIDEGLAENHHVRMGDVKVRPLSQVRSATRSNAGSKDSSDKSESGGWWMVLAALAASVVILVLMPGREQSSPNGLASFPTETEPAEAALEPQPVVPAEPKEFVDTARQSPGELHEPQNLMQISLLTVVDIQMSQAAWNAGKFDQLLGQLGINGAEDFVADRDALRSFIEQTLPGDPPQESGAEVALMYVHCNATLNDKLYVSLQSDKASYPNVKIMTSVVPESTSKIMDAMQRSGRSGANKNYSRLIQLDSPESLGSIVPQFEAPKQDPAELQVGIENLDMRDSQAANLFGVGGDKLEADCIVILRKVP